MLLNPYDDHKAHTSVLDFLWIFMSPTWLQVLTSSKMFIPEWKVLLKNVALGTQRCSLTCSGPDMHGAAVPRAWWPRRRPGLVPSTLASSTLVRGGSEPSMTLWFTDQRGISSWEPVRRQTWCSLQTWIFLINLLIFGCTGSQLLHVGFL